VAIIVTTVLISTLTTILINVVVVEVEDSEVVAGADPLWEEFEPRVPIKQGSTAGSEMTLPF
jgi:hypothetical protein